jgi:L-fuconolactonase
MIIDTHTHFYDPGRPAGVPWPNADSPLYRRVLPADLSAVAGGCGVTGTVVVEASEWVEDNQWLLDLAGDEPLIHGVIGRLEPTEHFTDNLERFTAHPLYRGIRARGETLMAAEADDAVMANLVDLGRRGLILDLLGGASLPQLRWLVERAPGLRVVINHFGSAPDRDGHLDEDWRRHLHALTKLPQVYCKLSGFKGAASKHHDPVPLEPSFYRPVFETMLEILGIDRLLYASNWPVSERVASYENTFAIVADWVERLNVEDGRKVWAGNAYRAYGPLQDE